MKAEIVFLGSGTSMGVPTLGCRCAVCTSTDPRNRRTRPSIAVRWHQSESPRTVVIDTGPDFREQALREHIRHIDAVLYTHAHADHILGMDDLRPLSFQHKPYLLPLYADETTAAILRVARVPSVLRCAGAVTPGARRRAVTRNAVWPIMRCSGRTAKPTTCQPRTNDSHAAGSVKPPCARSDSTARDSCVVVAT